MVPTTAYWAPPVLGQDAKERTAERSEAPNLEERVRTPQFDPLPPDDRVFKEGDLSTNCDEAFRVLERFQSIEPTEPGYEDEEFQFRFADAEQNVRACIDYYGVLPRDGEDPIEECQDQAHGRGQGSACEG